MDEEGCVADGFGEEADVDAWTAGAQHVTLARRRRLAAADKHRALVARLLHRAVVGARLGKYM